MMKKTAFAAAVLLLAGAHTPAFAQAKAAPKPAPQAPLTKDQQEHAVQDFAILTSAMRSDKIGDDVKSSLMLCIYSVSLGDISSHIDKLIAANPGKIDRQKPDDVLSAMAAVCGYKAPAGAASAAPAPAPSAPKGAAVGR